MSLEEWDRRVAPFLATIGMRAGHILIDAKQIVEWVQIMPAAPDFPTEAVAKLNSARAALYEAISVIEHAMDNYDQKEKVS